VSVSGNGYVSSCSTGLYASAGARRCHAGGNTTVLPGGMQRGSGINLLPTAGGSQFIPFIFAKV